MYWPLEESVRLTREIASGLGHAHHHGIVHRDIKPANILLPDGIARAPSHCSEDSTTATLTMGRVVGTTCYMAPEQARGDEVDGRTDLNAMACVLYEMLAGAPPFTGGSGRTVIQQQLHAVLEPITGNDLSRWHSTTELRPHK